LNLTERKEILKWLKELKFLDCYVSNIEQLMSAPVNSMG
jgi:hypothetical protein